VDFELGEGVRDPTVVSGPELMARLDPDDPLQASNLADIEAVLEATDADIDRLAMLNAVSADGEAFVGAIRVAGADTEVILAAYVDSTFDDLGEPRTEAADVGGKAVTRILDDAAPDQPALVVYATGDTVWVIRGSDESVEAVLESLP
jgi:hypothetical protein